MSGEVKLDPSWQGLTQKGPKKMNPDKLIAFADAVKAELVRIRSSDTPGSPAHLKERAKVDMEIAGGTFRTSQAVTNAFNHSKDLIAQYYEELLTQLENAATTARGTADASKKTDKDAATGLTTDGPASPGPHQPAAM